MEKTFFFSCLSVRTASQMKEGDFSVTLNTFILKVIIKKQDFTGIKQINRRQKPAGKLAEKSSIGFDCSVCVKKSCIYLLCRSPVSMFPQSSCN